MRTGILITNNEGSIAYMTRKGDAPRGKSFWVKIQMAEPRQSNRMQFFQDLIRKLADKKISGDGGEFGGWDWQLLISADEPNTDLDDRIRGEFSDWLSSRGDVDRFELGDPKDPTSMVAIISEEFKKAEKRAFPMKETYLQEYTRLDQMIQTRRYTEALGMAQDWIKEMEAAGWPSVKIFLPRAYGFLGFALYRLGSRDSSIEALRKARDLCKAIGDDEGVDKYQADIDCVPG